MFIWDIKQLDKASVYRTFMSHNGPVHDIQLIPNSLPVGLNMTLDSDNTNEHIEDENLTKFVTCSSDRTIRFWHYIDPVSADPARQIEI